MLTSKFENLRIPNDEIIFDFYVRFCEIINEAFAFRKQYSKMNLI